MSSTETALTQRAAGLTASLAIVMSLSLIACSGGKDGAFMDKVMKSWEGQAVDDVMRRWGYPDDEKYIADKRLLIWDYTPGYAVETGASPGASLASLLSGADAKESVKQPKWTCRRIVEIDEDMVVVGTDWSGNNCPFYAAGPYKDWER